MHSTAKEKAILDDIRKLAKRHNVRYVATDRDAWASHVTRLAGDNVVMDEPAQLLLALRRAGHLTSVQARRLHGAYLRAKYE